MHCYTASRGTTALQREISLKTKMLLRDFNWGLTKSCVGSDWLQGGCVPSTGSLLALPVMRLSGDVLSWASPRNSRVYGQSAESK